MNKQEVLKFIKEKKETLIQLSQRRSSGRITPLEQKTYKQAYKYVDPKSRTVCFTCGRSAQIMATQLLNWYEENRAGRKRKTKGES